MSNYFSDLQLAWAALWGSVQALFDKGLTAYRIFIVLVFGDKLGNALAAGNPKVTISARTHFLATYGRSFFFSIVERVIDFSFYPQDGHGHCRQAWEYEKDEEFRQGPVWALVLLSLMAVIGSLLIAVILYTLHYTLWLNRDEGARTNKMVFLDLIGAVYLVFVYSLIIDAF